MNEIDFRNLVRKTLDAQQTYFKSRKQTDLVVAKDLEKKVRKELDAGPDISAEDEAPFSEDAQLGLFEENDNEATEDQH